MFVANTLTAWMEAIRGTFHAAAYQGEGLKDIPVHTDYPVAEVDYPGLWVNYSMQGSLKNVGIGHVEYYPDDDGGLHKVLRWHFGGMVEITVAAMSNLERALLLDELTRTIAVGRPGLNPEGVLRGTIDDNDLIGQIVTWESFVVGAFSESQGTPWGTDDVVYEATVSLHTSGECVIDEASGVLVPLSKVVISEQIDETPGALPEPGTDGWV